MYISPNSTVEIFSDIGLSANYDNALYFSSTADKDSYFSNIHKIATLTNILYVSQQKGIIRVGTPIANLLSAGYLRYKIHHMKINGFMRLLQILNTVQTV